MKKRYIFFRSMIMLLLICFVLPAMAAVGDVRTLKVMVNRVSNDPLPYISVTSGNPNICMVIPGRKYVESNINGEFDVQEFTLMIKSEGASLLTILVNKDKYNYGNHQFTVNSDEGNGMITVPFKLRPLSSRSFMSYFEQFFVKNREEPISIKE